MIKIVKIKKCSKCKIKKSFNLFGKDKRNKSGLGAWCKDCCNKDSKRWRKTNSEKFKQSKIKWNKLVKNIMQIDCSWDNAAKEYMEIYKKLIEK